MLVSDAKIAPGVVATRLIALDDAPALSSLLVENREFLAPWSPVMPDSMFTESGQAAIVAESLTRFEHGEMLPHVIIDVDGELVGRINLASITHRAFQSAGMGYWVAQQQNGRGVAAAAVACMLVEAFEVVGLHRVQAETLARNVASQRVLERNGLEWIGFAPKYLQIADQWQDHVIYQRVNGNWANAAASS